MAVDIPWVITSMKKCSNQKTYMLNPNNIELDFVVAYNIEMEVSVKKRRKISLCGVPSFLVEAFAWLETNDAWSIQGIFRREGNSQRMKNTWRIFCGQSPIPNDFTVHDVCSLIKRFFREIKTPIFNNNQQQLLNFAEIKEGGVLVQSLLAFVETLPVSYRSTLGFLMRQLKKASDHSNTNHMDVSNLATIFAPSLFRDETVRPVPKKKRPESQDLMLNMIRARNELQTRVVEHLIQYSNLIGLPPIDFQVRRKNPLNFCAKKSPQLQLVAKLAPSPKKSPSTPRRQERSASMINPSSRYRIELPDICEQAKRSPSISLFSIPFMRERSNSASRGPGANPLIFRRIERSPSTSRPSACLSSVSKRHLSSIKRPTPARLTRERSPSIRKPSSAIKMQMQTECPLLRELPRPHSRSPLKPAQIVNQNHDECRGRSPIKNSPRITATKSPFATSKKKRDKTHDRLKTIPTAVKTTYHYNDVAPSKPPPPPAVFGGENYPFALSQMSPIHGLAESAFERSSAIFRQIINSKTSKDLQQKSGVQTRSMSSYARPSIVQFQENNPGYVRQLARQMDKLSGKQ